MNSALKSKEWKNLMQCKWNGFVILGSNSRLLVFSNISIIFIATEVGNSRQGNWSVKIYYEHQIVIIWICVNPEYDE